MTDHEYHELVDAMLLALEEQIEDCEVDLDYETNSGLLEVIFPDKSKIVINKQPPLHQVWVATKFNGHHFELHGDKWIDNRSGAEFWQFISDAATRQAGDAIVWTAN
ncbi:iron donor protein CyaY [Pseudoalteromonas xiamenensis]|jgi:CyaY protein|uniref:Iron-sulfur cluster assembly protein CyaY n=1 Tax=Pseudoalteromonas xiamenensis TaxID=882626 RepID=A0A975DFA6_9GAMM|nr:iron donor protein CyaY [Pseudoalteromonas xiamenensis]QTH70235.1 iron donor protein CyaY [Pseudoalteromonas xiamenensis]